jgi:hypothetical protein
MQARGELGQSNVSDVIYSTATNSEDLLLDYEKQAIKKFDDQLNKKNQ